MRDSDHIEDCQPLKVAVIGSYFRDMIFYSESFPLPGETVKSTFESGHGGKGSNQALCAAKLGLSRLVFVSSVGKDAFGTEIINYYKDNGIEAYFNLSEKPTGCAGIFVQEKDGENEIQIAEGAMGDLCLQEIRNTLIERCQDVDLFVFECEMPYESVHEIMVFVRELAPRASILLNPAPFRSDYNYEELLKLVDILVPNETELTGLFPGLSDEPLVEELPTLRSLGIKHLIVTLGEKGCEYIGMDSTFHVPAIHVVPVDTTGAGDCFIGAFCRFFTGGNFENAIEMACIAAGLSTERQGTSRSCPSLDEVLSTESGTEGCV